MTTREVQDTPSNATYVAKVRPAPGGETKLAPDDVGTSAYGPVEIAWYPDRLKITALGAGPASIAEMYLCGNGQDITIEIRLPSLDELLELVPGAD